MLKTWTKRDRMGGVLRVHLNKGDPCIGYSIPIRL
jgi:hypothetical protein